MKLKLIIVIIVGVATLSKVFGQQVPLNNFYTHNLFSINPAATGIQGYVAGNLNYRDQWSGLKGAPETTTFGVHGLISQSMGLGVNIENNVSGVLNQLSTDLNYSYRLLLKDKQSLAFGLKVGYTKNIINYDNVVVSNEEDPTLYASPVIDETLVKAGFGMHYNWDKLNIHIATPLLYGAQEKKYLQTLYSFVSYDFLFSEDIWKIQPSILYRRADNKFNQFDLNVLAEWDKRVWGSISYRTNKSFTTSVGVFIRNIGIGYAYEVNRNKLMTVASGSHEIMLQFESSFSVSKKDPHHHQSKRRLARF